MGHIDKRDNGRWRARYRAPDSRERSKTFDRKADAERFLASVTVDRARGDWLDPALGRVRPWLYGIATNLVARHPGGVVVAVSHADPIKAAVAAALGTHLDLFQRIVISPCSVTAVAYGAGGPTVLTVNHTAGSLSELRPS